MVQVAKLYHTTDAQSFRAFGRVISGTLRKGMSLKVLGEGFSPEDEEDMMKATVDDLWISQSRYFVGFLPKQTLSLTFNSQISHSCRGDFRRKFGLDRWRRCFDL